MNKHNWYKRSYPNRVGADVRRFEGQETLAQHIDGRHVDVSLETYAMLRGGIIIRRYTASLRLIEYPRAWIWYWPDVIRRLVYLDGKWRAA